MEGDRNGGVSKGLSKRKQFLPEFDTASIVHRENLYCRTSCGAQSLDVRAPENKVVRPSVAAWMKQGCHFARHGIDPGQIGTFMKIASVAGKRQIVGFVETAVLFRNDVFDVMEHFTVLLL